MRIGYLHSFPSSPITDGARVHVHEMLSRVQAAGHEVHVLGHEPCPGAVRHAHGARGIASVIEAVDVAIVRVDGSIEFVTAAEARKCGKPLVIEMNAPVDERRAWWAGVPSRFGHLRSRIKLSSDRRRLAHVCRQAAAVYVVSAELASYARRRLGCQRVHVIPNGGNVKRFCGEAAAAGYRGAPHEFLSVLWLGSALPWQDNTFLGNVARLLAGKTERIRFLACSTEAEPVLANLPNATCRAGLSYCDLVPVIEKCQIGLVYYPAYTWLHGTFYNSPIKLFDFMAAGLCVVASPFGQISRAIRSGENGILLQENTPEQCAHVLRELLTSPTLLGAMGRNARADVAAYYNWDRVVDRLCGLLHGAISGKDLTTTVEDDRRAEPMRPAGERGSEPLEAPASMQTGF